jgi:type I restriction enzyme S subunit
VTVTSISYAHINKNHFNGVGIQHFTGEALAQFEVLLPPLPEQQRMVGILDEAFEGIATARANAERNLESARALVQPTFMSILNSFDHTRWRVSTVEATARTEKGSIRTGPFGSQLLHSEFVDEGISVLGIDNAVQNRFAWNERRSITPKKFSELSRYQVKPGDVLITIMGSCGRCAIVPDDIPTAINSKHLCCITLDHERCLPEFLHAYFLYHPTAQEFLSKRAKGAIMAGLNMGIIRELPLMLPPVEQQRTVVKKVAEVRESSECLESFYQRKITALDELKTSLLHQACTGQL